MLADLNDRLTTNLEQKRLKAKLERDLRAVESELGAESARLESLRVKLAKGKVDLEKLEHTSLMALFHAVLGSREQQLEKERQEMFSAQLAYQQSKHQVDYLEREGERLTRQLEKLGDVERAYELLLAEKEGLLRQTHPDVVAELEVLTEQIAALNAEIKEITEAATAGDQAVSGLEQVIKSLESAQSWGTWDLIGGGFLSTVVKHSRIDNARGSIHEVQIQMSRFKRELADVQQRVDLHIDIGEFESFADFFFDGLIIDWIVQSKIVDSLERCKQAKKKIAAALNELHQLRQNAQGQVRQLGEQRTQLIEGA